MMMMMMRLDLICRDTRGKLRDVFFHQSMISMHSETQMKTCGAKVYRKDKYGNCKILDESSEG